MALSKERLGEIAVLVLTHKLKKEGMMVKPKELRSEVFNAAKAIGISPIETAEFLKEGLKLLFEDANRELDALITSVEGWQKKAE